MGINRKKLNTALAIIGALSGWGIFRLLFPIFDYFPPESLIRDLEPSFILNIGFRKPAGLIYLGLALVLMTVFFKIIQKEWPGKRGIKGLIFGMWIGGVWSFGFLTGWLFLGTTLKAEFLNIVVDLIPLAIAGWLIGLAGGRDVPGSKSELRQPWIAIILIAIGFVGVHTLGANLLVDLVGPYAKLLLLPSSLTQLGLLLTLGAWAGGMYVILRTSIPFKKVSTRAAFFAFGVFGHCWTWFNLFFIIEFAGVLPTIILLGLIGSLGIYAGVMAYEKFIVSKPLSL